jgi:two-component system, OmpR family, response regulator MprA
VWNDSSVRTANKRSSNDDMRNRIAQSQAAPNQIIPGARILVVDDDAAICQLHAAILDFEGYQVEMADDGADALDQLATGRFDLVFTDREMPILDGERMIFALRSAGSRIPVVLISGSLAEYPLSAWMASEVFAALPKPVPAAEVLATIFAALKSVQHQLRSAA